jgi:N-acetylmuramoyl-L-alanine amidase
LLLPTGTPPPGGAVGTIRLTPAEGHIDLRVVLPDRLPFQVEEGERTLVVTIYGGVSDTDWLLYGPTDPLVRRVEWRQPTMERYQVVLSLTRPIWGYQTFWDSNGDLILRVRRPPEIDANRPLHGLLIAVDPGHPPAGATGPTGLTEAEANLAIALYLQPLLEAAGARVLMTRTDTSPVSLTERTEMATAANADLLISVHNNAFPDGVNPFLNNGTSVYFNQPHSRELARSLQHALLKELGLRDLGIGRGDLALVRPTWMPAVLTESLFMMIPQQEAALRDPVVQERIARAHLRGIEAFLRGYKEREAWTPLDESW